MIRFNNEHKDNNNMFSNNCKKWNVFWRNQRLYWGFKNSWKVAKAKKNLVSKNLNISGTSKTSQICFLTCTLIDSSGKERSGFYTQFDLIALEPKKVKTNSEKDKEMPNYKINFFLYHLARKK